MNSYPKPILIRCTNIRRNWAVTCLTALLVVACTARGNATDIVAQVEGDAVAGVSTTITLSGPVGKPDEFKLPHVSGLTVNGTGSDPNSNPPTYSFFVTPDHAGDYTIPAFDIHSDDGKMFHVQEIKLHVGSGG